MTKGRVFFRVIVGGYLAYLGFGLVRDSFADKPDHYMFYIGIGAVFILIGLWWFLKAAGAIMRHDYVEPGDVDAEDEAVGADDVDAEDGAGAGESSTEESPAADAAESADKEETEPAGKDSVIEED